MKVEKAKEYINKRLVAQGRQLLDAEILVLRAAWDDLTYEQVAKEAGYKLPSLRSGTAPKLFNRISGIVGEKVTKKTFRPILTKHISAQKPQDSYLRRSDTHPQPAIDTVSTKSKIKNIIGAQPAINPKFYGRTEALQALKQGIEFNKCVLLVGTEGVGKRSLLARLLQSTPLPFSQIIWKPVLHAPTVESLEDELLQLFPTQDTSLMTLFTQQKYLLVLESIDSLLECSGSSKILHRGYISFIRRIIEETRSHVVLISNESIPQIESLSYKGRAFIYSLGGLDLESARLIFQEADLSDEENERLWDDTIVSLRGHPLLLRQVASWASKRIGDSRRAVARETVQFGLVQHWHEQLFIGQYLDDVDRKVLLEIAQTDAGISFADLLSKHGNAINNISRLIQIELIEQTINADNQEWLNIAPFLKRYLLNNLEKSEKST